MAAPDTPGEFPIKGSLTEAFVTHAGNVSDKWEQYLPIYDFVLANILTFGRPVHLLEIGVQNGGSLEIWSNVLPSGSTILGLDIDEACRSLVLPDNVTVKILDAGNAAELDAALDGLTFDIIVDDGSHISEHIIATFRNCFDRLKPSGFYVVEDLHASYWASHGGGFRKPGAAIEYFKTLVDAVHSDHFESDASESLGDQKIESLKAMGGKIASVAFFDSIVFVQKLANPQDRPFRRIFTGYKTPGVDIVSRLPQLPVEQLRHLLLCDSAFANFAPKLFRDLAESSESLGHAKAQLSHLNLHLTQVGQQLTAAHESHAQQSVVAEQRLRLVEDRANAYEALLTHDQNGSSNELTRAIEQLRMANEKLISASNTHAQQRTAWERKLRLAEDRAKAYEASLSQEQRGPFIALKNASEQLDLMTEQLTAAHEANLQLTSLWQQKLRFADDRAAAREDELNRVYTSTIWKVSRPLVRSATIIPVSVRSKIKSFLNFFGR